MFKNLPPTPNIFVFVTGIKQFDVKSNEIELDV